MSLIDFTQYQPPGVYIEQIASPLVGVSGIAPDVVAIVGPALGYKTVTESYALTGTTPITLAHYGANATSVTVQSQSGQTYQNTDFAATVINGATTAQNQVQVARTSGSNIPSGSVVYITYQYTDANYFLPATYTDYPTLKKDWGEPLNLVTNAITSPISLAAMLAFTNGAQQVVVCPTTDTTNATRTGLSTAYNNMAANEDIDIVVPLPVGISGSPGNPGDSINVGLDLASFLTQQAQQGIFSVGMLGYDLACTVGPDTIAGGVGSYRVQEHWPNSLNFYNGANNQTFQVSGYYLAAAWAGVLASLQRQVPLTKKYVSGFSGIPNSVFATMTAAYKNQLSKAGVAVTEVVNGGGLQMRHSVTTNTAAVTSRELSIIRAGDGMVEVIQNTLTNSGLIGSAFGPNTLQNIKSLMQGSLESLVNSGMIVGYNSLGVQQQGTTPVVVLVQFQYQPAYPLNYILVQYQIDTSTGSVSPVSVAPNPTGTPTANIGA